jgi:hypothetical protein
MYNGYTIIIPKQVVTKKNTSIRKPKRLDSLAISFQKLAFELFQEIIITNSKKMRDKNF